MLISEVIKDSPSIMDADKYVLVKCVLTETTVEFGPAPQSVPWTGYRGGPKVSKRLRSTRWPIKVHCCFGLHRYFEIDG